MRTWFKQICKNLNSVETPQDWGRVKGHLVMLQSPAVFYARNGEFYNPPPPPNATPSYPNILYRANTAKRERLRVKDKVLYVHWAKYVHTGRITVNIGAAAFDEWVIAALKDLDKGLNGVTICDVYNYIMENYAKISQAKVHANLDTFKETIDASRTLAVYIRKQELC